MKIVDRLMEERVAARGAETARTQLKHEVRELDERRLERAVRALPPAARRAMERDRGLDRER